MLLCHELVELTGLQMRHFSTLSLDERGKLLSDGLEDCRNDFEDAIDKAQKTTLHVFVVVLENAIEHIEELLLVLNH